MNTDIDFKDHSKDSNSHIPSAASAIDPKDHNETLNDEQANKTSPLLNNVETLSHGNGANGILSRVALLPEELVKLSEEEIKMKWHQQDMYINHLEKQIKELQEKRCEMIPIKNHEEKLKTQSNDFKRRENILVMKLATKEHDHLNHFVSELLSSSFSDHLSCRNNSRNSKSQWYPVMTT